MDEPIRDVLDDENRLLYQLIRVVQDFKPQTEEGATLRAGVETDLNGWRSSNNTLIEQCDSDRVKSLEREQGQLKALIEVATTSSVFADASPDHSSNWWKDHLTSELASAVRLQNLIT